MAKIIDITKHSKGRRKRARGHDTDRDLEDLPDINYNVFWDDPPSEDIDHACARERDGGDIPAILVKGCFALYHLVREHRRRRTKVPKFLLAFARTYEEPLIPAAETVYEDFFDSGCDPGEIPEHLLELGLATADDVAVCVRYVMRLHGLLEACTSADGKAPRDIFKSIVPRSFALPLLLGLMLAEYRRWATAQRPLKLV